MRRPGETVAAIPVPTERIFHIPGLGFDGLVGYSVLAKARETLGQSIALRDYGASVLANDARPGVILTHPGTVTPTAKTRIQDDWTKNANKAGKTVLLEEDIKPTTLGYQPEDVQFLGSQQWQVTEVARWLRIAPHKIADLTRATFSNIEEQNIDHVTSTIRPWCAKWEQQIRKDIIVGSDLFAEHLLDGLLRGKTLERYQAFTLAVNSKAMVPNEWRAFENWNPVEWGDEIGRAHV